MLKSALYTRPYADAYARRKGTDIRPSLTIVIPCLNEEPGIDLLHDQLEPVIAELLGSYDVELLFVDDGSTDSTVERIRAAWPRELARVASHDRNRGLGSALWTGAHEARGDLVLYIDSDCTYRPGRIPELLALLDAETDIVTASPYHPQGAVIGVPRSRLVPSRVLSFLYRAVAGSSLWTFTSMFRVYRRRYLLALPRWSTGYVALAEMLILPLLSGARVREFPTVLYARPRYSASKIRLFSTIRAHLRFLARVAVIRARGHAPLTVSEPLEERARPSLPRA